MRTAMEWSELRERHRKGESISRLAEEFGLTRNTVRKYVDSETPPKYGRRPMPSILDPYKEYIRTRLAGCDISARRILEEVRAMGYTGGYTVVKDFALPIRRDRAVRAEIRFETPPGEQAQADWIDLGRHMIGGEPVHLRCFVMTLGYSRCCYAEITDNASTGTFIQCHVNGFGYVGGTTETILYDNLKSVVLRRGLESSESVFNPMYMDFARFHDIRPRLCRPGIEGAKTKGKVERFIQYLEKDFFAGRQFESLSDLNSQLRLWLDKANSRVHGTTGEVPWERLKEEGLKPVNPARPYLVTLIEPRKVSRDCFVSYRGSRYSVPWRYAGRECQLHVRSGRLEAHVDGETVARHEVVPGHRTVRVKEHFEGLYKLRRDMNLERHQKRMGVVYDPSCPRCPEVAVRDLSRYDSLAGGRMNDYQ